MVSFRSRCGALRDAIGRVATCGDFAGRQLREPFDRLFAQRGCVPRDRSLAGLLDARHAAVERRNQLAELAYELIARHRHGFDTARLEFRRDTFQTSPQLPQRQ